MSKTDKVRQAVIGGDYQKALSIACRFKMQISKDDQATLKRAHECRRNRVFYESLGYDCDALFSAGIAALKRLYHTT